MTRVGLLQNKRLLSIVFLSITFIFAGIAIFLAYTLATRPVNPDETAADKSTCRTRIEDANYCSSGRVKISTKCDVCNPESGCTETAECTNEQPSNKVLCRTENRDNLSNCSSVGGRGTVDIYCESCSGEVNCEPRNIRCEGSQGGPQPTLNKCNEYDTAATQGIYPACTGGLVKKCAVYCQTCTGQGGSNPGTNCAAPVCSECGGTVAPPAVPTLVSGAGWPAGANCRYRQNDPAGYCRDTNFTSTSALKNDNRMLVCRNATCPGDGYCYGSAQETSLACGADCRGKQGGVYNAPECGNPYQCPYVPTLTPPDAPPPPTCNTVCDTGSNQSSNSDDAYVTTCTDYQGVSTIVQRIPTQCSPSSCNPKSGCEGTDWVTRNCNYDEIGRVPNHPRCIPSTQLTCTSLTVELSGVNEAGQQIPGANRVFGTASLVGSDVVLPRNPVAGERVYFSATGNNTTSGNYAFIPFMRSVNPTDNYINNCSYFYFSTDTSSGIDARVRARTDSSRGGALYWLVPANGSRPVAVTGLGSNLTALQQTFDACQGANFTGQVVFGFDFRNLSSGARWCWNPLGITSAGILLTSDANGNPTSDTWSGYSCSNVCGIRTSSTPITNTPTSTTTTTQIQAPTCTNLSVTNTRTSETCSGSSSACTAFRQNLRQGDTLTATVTGANSTGYLLQTNPSYSGQSNNYQSANTFSNVVIPTNNSTTRFDSFNITARTSNGTTNVTSANCQLNFTFTVIPDIDKSIDSANSTNLSANNVVTTSSTVRYNIVVENDGTAVLRNLLVVDRLSAFNPANNGAAVNPPYGDIINATDLTRTVGSLSNPSPVTPRIGRNSSGTAVTPTPNGNSFTGQNVKSVEWNSINQLFPSERYTGNITVDIGSYTGTPTLRNTVCLYSDVNNNGIYDSGTDTEVRCDSVDVFTQEPTFTVNKSASDTELTIGENLTYTLTIRNTSANPLDLNNVTVTDTLDNTYINGVTVSNISNGGTRTNNVINWSSANLIVANGGNANLAANGTFNLTFQMTIDTDFFAGSTACSAILNNNVFMSSSSPNFRYDAPPVSIAINRPCGRGFDVVKTANPTSFTPGQTITYSAVVTNNGDTAAPLQVVNDDYPEGFTYQSGSTTFTNPNGSTFELEPVIANGVMTWTIPTNNQVSLQPGQTISFTYRMTAINSTTGTYPNRICVESPDGGCDDAVVLPRTGIITVGLAIIGGGLIASGIHLYRKNKSKRHVFRE